MSNHTYPPCKSCDAHNILEDINSKEHSEILTILGNLGHDVQWMNVIGKWMLGTVLLYFIMIAQYIYTADWVHVNDITTLSKRIEKGEALRYHNKESISHVERDIAVIAESIRKDNK